jgi:hypothetical protein
METWKHQLIKSDGMQQIQLIYDIYIYIYIYNILLFKHGKLEIINIY